MLIAPSILSGDLLKIGKEIKQLESAGADWIHLDVMDGQFVRNISFGIPVVKSVRQCTDLPLDVHLMIKDPENYIEEFIKAGADIVTFHVESTECVEKNIKEIKKADKKAGIALKPNTNIEEILPFLRYVDIVLVMTVEPGFSGQRFLSYTLSKVVELKKIIDEKHLPVKIEVDGGINPQNVNIVKGAGAEIFVAGNSIFFLGNYKENIDALRNTNWSF